MGSRSLVVGGLLGPAAFVGAWTVGGALDSGYSPIEDAISRLAAVDADGASRALMTAGFVAFGVGVPLYGLALRSRLAGPAWAAAVTTGLATLGVAATPLEVSPTVSLLHGAFATTGYASLALVPLLSAPGLRAQGRPGLARLATAAGVASGICLAATVAGPAHGLFQRLGLTIGDAWIAGTALALRDHH